MRLVFTVLAMVVLSLGRSFGQGCVTIANLPDTIDLCRNSTVQLSPTVVLGGPNYTTDTFWTPATGLSNPNIINPVATVTTSSQLYILNVVSLTPNNFVVNGNFSSGNTGFNTSYIYGTGGSWGLLSNEGQYAVTTSPNLVHTNFAAFSDHTGNTGGQMMVVNGSSTANTNVWCQNITVQPNSWYDFSAWGASCVNSAPAILQFAINGVPLGSPLSLPTTTGQWTNFHATWFSGSNTNITICITDNQTAASGNDFAIDDIEFRRQCTATDSVYIRVTNMQTTINSSVHFRCHNDSVQFFAVNGADVPDTYSWDLGDGTPVVHTQNPAHIYTTQGSYNVRLITQKRQCKDTFYAVINTLHPLSASFTTSTDSICLGQTITFASTGTAGAGPATHYWDFGDGNTGSSASETHTYAAIGRYVVKYVITDAVPCKDTATDTVWVFQSFNPSFTSSNTTFCEGQAVYLKAKNDHPYATRTWNFGDGMQTGDFTQVDHSYDSSGVFTIKLLETYSQCPPDSFTVSVTVNPFPKVNLGRDTFLCPQSGPIVVGNLVFNNPVAVDYKWSTGETGPSITVREPGEYSVIARTAAGCSTTDSIQVRKHCYMDIPNAFTPNGSGMNEYFYPRQLLTSDLVSFHMRIYNRWGQLLFETSRLDGRGWDGSFNGEPQPMGVYVYVIDAEITGTPLKHYQGNVTLLR